jgi:ABC-type phosphate/phosphonate transport system substrate-binding protein
MNVMPLNRLISSFLLTGFLLCSGWACAEDLFAKQSLRIGFYARAYPDFSSEDIKITVKVLGEAIGTSAGIPTTITIYENIALMRSAFELGEINFVLASTLNLVNDFNSNLFTDGFRVIRLTEHSDTIAVLTRKNQGIDTFKALAGKRLTLVENSPIADLYMDFLALSTFNKQYKTSFKETPKERKAQRVILKLFFGQTDAICVYLNTYNVATELNPQLLSKIQIISQLDNIPQGAGLFHKNVDPTFREHVITEMLKMNENIRGQQLLHLFKADKTIRASVADLAGAEKLYGDYLHLRKPK